MLNANDIVLCRYHYDPLDRVARSSPAEADTVQRFYQKSRLATEVQGPVRRVVFQSEEQLLAQHESGGGRDSSVLLATDQQRSVLHQVDPTQQTARVYTAYGFAAPLGNLPGFNGEQPDPVTGHYLLGNGYRAFNPVLMRFNSPDSLSPFGKGGLNVYAYCVGDPVNRVDPTGHIGAFWRLIKASLSHISDMAKASPAKGLGQLSSVIKGKPHLIEKIIGYLPGKDMVNLASVSKEMNAVVYSVSSRSTNLFARAKFSAPEIAKGSAQGILPIDAIPRVRAYDAVMQQVAIRGTANATARSLGRGTPRGQNIRRGAILSTD